MLTPDAKQRARFLVLLAVVSDYIGVSMMRVTLPFFAKALGGSAFLMGGIESAYGVGQICGAFVLPKLSDTWGRKTILTFSCLGSFVGYSLACLARYCESPNLLLLSRIPVGLAKQTVTVSRAVVADTTNPDNERSKWMSWLGTALGVGCVIGPFVGGQAAEHLGEIVPALLAVGVFAIMTPIVFFYLPETSPAALQPGSAPTGPPASPSQAPLEPADGGQGAARRGRADSPVRQATGAEQATPAEKKGDGGPAWQSPAVLAVLSILMLPELGLIAHASVTLYSFCMNDLGKGKAWVGNLTAGSAIFQAFFAAVMPKLTSMGWSDKSVMQLGVWAFAIASFMIWEGQGDTAILLAAPLGALANGILRSYPATLLSKEVVQSRQGEAMGLLDLCSSGVRVLAPLAFGKIIDLYGNGNVFLFQGGVFVASSASMVMHTRFMGKGAKVATA